MTGVPVGTGRSPLETEAPLAPPRRRASAFANHTPGAGARAGATRSLAPPLNLRVDTDSMAAGLSFLQFGER